MRELSWMSDGIGHKIGGVVCIIHELKFASSRAEIVSVEQFGNIILR